MNKTVGEYKVGFYCSSLSHGGLELNIIRFVDKMKSLEKEIVLFLVKNSSMHKDAKSKKLQTIEIEENKKYFDFGRAKLLADKLKSLQIKILMVGATRDVAFASLVKRFYMQELKLIYHQQMQLGIDKKDFLHTLRFKQYDSWIAPLPYLKKEVGKRTRYPVSRVSVIPLCIETDQFVNANISKAEARKILELPQSGKIIGILGRIDPLKRQDFLIRAIYNLKQKGIDADLLIMGEPTANTGDDYFNKIKSLIRECNLDQHIHIRPFSNDTIPFYRAIDIFAMTTKSETFGMVTVEAMATGLAIIATRSGGSIEILEHGRLGLLYEPDDQQDFIVQVQKLINDTDLAVKLGKLAKEEAKEKYDLAYQCRKIDTIITKLLSKK